MRILVTGGTGLIGRALQDKVIFSKDEWCFAGSSDVNLLDESETLEYFKKVDPTMVVHLAARVGGLYNNINHNERMYVDNMKINLNVMNASEEIGVQRFIAILSTCIFPEPAPALPLTEDMIHFGPSHPSNEGYAMAKRMLELHTRLSSLETICLIPTNLYGPYDNFNIDDAHVIPALIHKCYLAKQSDKPFVVAGSGKAVRQFLYNGDMASIIEWAVNKHCIEPHEKYICAPDEEDEITIDKVAHIIAKTMNYEDKLEFDTVFPEGQAKKTASNKLLKEAMGEQLVFSNFEEKLVKTIEWFIEHYEKGVRR